MTTIHLLRKCAKAILWVLLGIVLLPLAIIVLLYSPWGQYMIRVGVLPLINSEEMRIELRDFSLRFPLRLELEGLSIYTGDTEMMHAGRLDADVDMWPLLRGEARLSKARVDTLRYTMGAPDSAMYMTIAADSLGLRDASVALSSMHIRLTDGDIRHGRVAMTLNPDTTAADTTAAEPSDMIIDIRRLGLDDFAYSMRMLPTIDSIGADISRAVLRDGRIDLRGQTVALGTFAGSGLDVAYIAPDSATVASYAAITAAQAADTAASTSAPWTVTIDSLAFGGSRALYTTRGTEPLPGLDFAYIAVDSLDLAVSDFYNQAAIVRVPLRISGTERCGVRLDASGTLDIGEEGLRFKDFNVSTPPGTALAFSGLLGMGDMTSDPSVPLALDLDGKVSAADARLMFPAFLPYIAAMPPHGGLDADISLSGTAGALDIARCDLTVNTVARLSASGSVKNVFDPDRLGGRIKLSGALVDINPMLASVLDPSTARSLRVPRTTFDGAVDMASGVIDGRLTGVTEGGRINLDGHWNGRATAYRADLRLVDFPVGAFMPAAGVGRVTASLRADGRGLDPFARSTRLDADATVTSAAVADHIYRDITANVKVADGHAALDVTSADPAARASLTAEGNLDGSTYVWHAELDGSHIDLHSLGLAPDQATLAADLTADVSFTPTPQTIAAKVALRSLSYTTPPGTISLDNVLARLNADTEATNLSVHNRDFYAFAGSPAPIDTLMARFSLFSEVMASQMARHRINVDSLQRALPEFSIDVNAGPDNALTDLLADSRTGWQSLHLTATNDSTLGVDARVLGFTSGTTRLDTITADLSQVGTEMLIKAAVDNRPGTFDQWAHVRLDGYVGTDSLGMKVAQHDISGKQGYLVGLRGALTDSTATVHFYPIDPTIAYKQWTVNPDNYITWHYAHKHLDANLRMEGAGSSLAIFTNHIPGHDDEQEALTVQLKDVHLSDWIAINPFAPPMKGDLSADLSVSEHDGDINGAGTVTLTDFTYGRERVGTIGADLKVSTDLGGRIRAAADLSVDGVRTVTLAGALNDSTAGSPLALDLSLIHFPLEAANPFLPAGTGRLRGTLNGQMDVSGTGTDPKLDGWLQFDSTAMKVAMTGTWYPFSDVRIPVEGSVVKFDGFGIRGIQGHPLSVDGSVDISSMANPRIDLRMTATDFQLCDSRRAPAGADIYGKGFINLRATVRGDMSFMAVGADLTILSGTNITYVMPDATNAITRRAESEMVRFVNFADTAAVQQADSVASSEMAMRIDASLTIQSGAAISVDLSADGKNKVRLQPEGTVDFTMAPFSDPRVTGRLNIPRGFVRYTPPLMSEKHFDFKENSYIAFNGDMMNPVLSVHAVDVMKANVTQSGQNSRLVNFDVALDVTGTLNDMKVAFDLSTDDDVTVANELQSMSPEQRANQAMNMLLYNVYTGPGTKGNASLGGNPLYSFLASQLNTWAANNIRGVDLSFGVDQYDRTVGGSTSQTTSYSYQVSKSLFNNRFKIVVGGNYSTDADADENFAQNLIRDISFEYFLNKAQTMYVRIFRHTGYESILEGEITQTGVGFVYKKKLSNLKHIFGRRRHKRPDSGDTPTVSPTDIHATTDESK